MILDFQNKRLALNLLDPFPLLPSVQFLLVIRLQLIRRVSMPDLHVFPLLIYLTFLTKCAMDFHIVQIRV